MEGGQGDTDAHDHRHVLDYYMYIQYIDLATESTAGAYGIARCGAVTVE